MKTSNATYFLLLFVGTFLMGFFGSQLSRSIGPADSWTSHLLLPGYSIGLIVISISMFLRLSSELRNLESKVRDLENKAS
jgi:hypothetical protein